jgi:hypothetical protein
MENLMTPFAAIPLDPTFERPVKQLVESLHLFFKERIRKVADRRWKPNPEGDYDLFLEYLTSAIGDEPRRPPKTPQSAGRHNTDPRSLRVHLTM